MKDSGRIMYHPNQENKTGSATYASFTRRNFSDNEALPGKKVGMKIVRDKTSFLNVVGNSIRQWIQKMGFRRT